MSKSVKETKSVAPAPAASSDLADNFAAFKAAQDARLAELEQKNAKLEAENSATQAQMDRLTIAAGQIVETKSTPSSDAQTLKAWSSYVRSGDETGLTLLEQKGVSSVDGAGGIVVPIETETAIGSALMGASPLRSLATVRMVSTGQFRKPVSQGGATAGWAGESDPRAETQAPELDLIEFPTGELYALPAATQALLDDSVANVDEWLAEEVQDVFSAQETAAFINGDGVNKPRGILSYPQAEDSVQEWGQIGYVATGTEGDLDANDPIDALIDLTYAPETKFRAEASFLMNRRTLGRLRKVKDADGNYIWQAATASGQPSTLLGFPVIEVEDMPDIGVDTTPIAFGDFRRGYLIADRQGVRVLRDPYSSKPFVLFYTTKRVGGGVQDFNAIKLLRCSAA